MRASSAWRIVPEYEDSPELPAALERAVKRLLREGGDHAAGQEEAPTAANQRGQAIESAQRPTGGAP